MPLFFDLLQNLESNKVSEGSSLQMRRRLGQESKVVSDFPPFWFSALPTSIMGLPINDLSAYDRQVQYPRLFHHVKWSRG